MAGACPILSPDDPLVRGLLGVVDCNVRELVHSGYMALFQAGGVFPSLLTMVLTIYVALIGYQLLIGRTQLRVSDFVLNAVKMGVVLALATQWDTYQALVYAVLFKGPEQLASAMLSLVQSSGSMFHGDVFDGLQTAFDDLTAFGSGYAAHAPAAGAAAPLLGGPGLGALMLTSSASILLLSTLGALLAAKITLGFLLAVGPVFVALLLFESTRGVFEGWIRASLAFAFAPLSVTLLLGVCLTMLEPTLRQMEDLQRQHIYALGPAYSAATLILVFAVVSGAALLAAGVIAGGFRLPRGRTGSVLERATASPPRAEAPAAEQPRAARIAAAVATLERRSAGVEVSVGTFGSDRRTTTITERGAPAATAADIVRLGQERPQGRRASGPRGVRTSAPTTSVRSAR